MDGSKLKLEQGYDSIAEDYATEFFDELARKPFDCQLLDDFGTSSAGKHC